MKIHRVLIDATNCPQSVINRYFHEAGVEYTLYHRDAFHLFIADDGTVESAIHTTDAFFHEHAERLIQLSTDESQRDDVSPELRLEFAFWGSIPTDGILLPPRLLANLDRTIMPITFTLARFS